MGVDLGDIAVADDEQDIQDEEEGLHASALGQRTVAPLGDELAMRVHGQSNCRRQSMQAWPMVGAGS
jgi:hypothetical protein